MSVNQKATLKDLVDSLGKVKAKLADLSEDEDVLKEMIKSRLKGEHSAEGKMFRCTVSTYDVTTVDYREVVESLRQTPKLKRLVADATLTVPRTTVKVTSRTGKEGKV